MTRRIPLTVLGGFLGAGKTTLLNRWLREAPAGRRVAVLVNDFGALNIDADLVAARSGDTVALTNGCVCCSIGDDLSAALLRVLAAEPAYDAVLIETSGVSDPWRVAQLGMAAPELALDGVIVLVDAAAALGHAGDPLLAQTLERQLAAADLLVVNKADLASPAQTQAVRAWIAQHASRTPVLETSQGAVPLAVLSGEALLHAAGDEHACGCGAGHAPGHAHAAQFETWSARPQQVLSTQALRDALAHMPAGVLRLKGIVRTGEAAWSEVQFAGRRGSVRAAAPPAGGAALVAIGLRGQLAVSELQRLLASARIATGA